MTPLVLALLISSGAATAMASSQTNAATNPPVAASSTGTAAPMPPKVSAVPVSEGCFHVLRVETTATVELEFGGDLGAMPPMTLRNVGRIPMPRTVGRVVAWSVEDFRSDHVFAEGVFTVPPCISAPKRPTVVTVVGPPPDIEIGTPLTITRTRFTFWNWTLRRFGGVG